MRWPTALHAPVREGDAALAADTRSPTMRTVAALSLAYLAAALLSLYLSRQPGSVAGLWFANAIAMAVLACHRPSGWHRLLSGIGAALALANWSWGDDVLLALSFVPANFAEILIGAWAIRAWGLARDDAPSLARLLRLLLAGAVLPQIAGATLGAATLALHGMAPIADVWLPWFEGSVIGAVSVLPLAIHVVVHGWGVIGRALTDARTLVMLPLSVGTALVSIAHVPFPFVFVLMPLLGAALWIPTAGLLLCTLATSLCIGVSIATGVFVLPPVQHDWQHVYVYLAYAGTLVPAQLLGAALGELRASHAKLARQALELRRSNEGLEQFVRIASHDLREPINTVAQFSALIAEDDGARLSPAGARYLQLIVTGGRRMRAILDGMLEFARLQRQGTVDLRPVELRAVLADVLTGVAGRIVSRQARVDVGALPRVLGDATTLGLLFQNLVANALKFVPDERSPHVRISASVEGPLVRIAVEDNGIGIEPGDLPKLFEPFQRLHTQRRFEGTGLGLALARQVAEMHDGTITVESTPGQGSRFVVTLQRG